MNARGWCIAVPVLVASLGLVGGCNGDLKIDPPIGTCASTQQCPPEQACVAGMCAVLEEGRVVGNFECIRDNPNADTGVANVVANLGGKLYNLAVGVSCVTTPSVVSSGLFFSIDIFGIHHGDRKSDSLTIFADEVTGLPGEPKALVVPAEDASTTDSGYLSVDDVADSTTTRRRVVGWITSGSVAIDVWPPSSGATLKGVIDAHLDPATPGRKLSAACTSVIDCGDDLTERCSNLSGAGSFCWTECDKDETDCAPSGVCVGYTTPLGTARKSCVAPCTSAGTCDNRALLCQAGTNGTKGCFR